MPLAINSSSDPSARALAMAARRHQFTRISPQLGCTAMAIWRDRRAAHRPPRHDPSAVRRLHRVVAIIRVTLSPWPLYRHAVNEACPRYPLRCVIIRSFINGTYGRLASEQGPSQGQGQQQRHDHAPRPMLSFFRVFSENRCRCSCRQCGCGCGLWMWIVGRDVNGVLAYKIKYRAKMELSVCAVVRVRNQTKPNRTEPN